MNNKRTSRTSHHSRRSRGSLTTSSTQAEASKSISASHPKNSDVYAFIDSQNLNLGIRSQGWQLDWGVFRQYLKSKYNVSRAFVCIGKVEGNESLYTYLEASGFELIFKPTLYHLEEDQKVVKGNVDAELVLHTMIHFPHFSKAIIVTGDGDFHCLVEYLHQQGKLRKIMTPTQHYSSLLRTFSKYIVRLDRLKESLKKKKTGIRVRPKP